MAQVRSLATKWKKRAIKKNDLNMAFSDSPNIPRLEHCHSMNWTKRKAVPLKDYHDEARATKDIEKFLENPCVLMKSKHTLLPDIINEMIEHIKTVKKINLNVEKAAKSVLADDGGLMECVQGLVYSRGSDVIPEKSFVVALGTTPTVVETQTCFSVTHRPFNLGDGLSEVKLICLILSPMKSKQTKSGIEVGRTYTTLLSANSLRRQLYEAKTVEEFVEIVKDGCKLVQERQTEEKEKERLEQMVGTETPEEEERPVKKFVKSIWPPGRLLYNDIKRRKKVYLSDFSDGFNDLTSVKKYLNAMMFLYFTLLLPVMAFGVINSYNTHKAIETRKGILAQAVGGIIYALFAGQPLSVVQCTIPIVLFIKLVYTFSVSLFNVDFLTFYTLVGLWNGIFLVVYAITGVSKIMAYCSRSTEEIVGIFTSIAFIVDSLKYVSKQFGSYWCDESGCDKAIPLAVFLTTFGVLLVSLAINNFKYSPYLSSTKRKLVAEYGLPFSVLILSLITGILFDGLGLEHFTDEQFEQDPPYSLFSFPDFKWNGCHGDISKRAAATDDSSEPPFNLGDGLSEVKLICLILSPMKSKQTKSGIEVGRTYTTLLSANSLRRQLYEAKTVEEFVEIVKDGCKLVQERQTEEKEKERLEQMVGTETPEEEERPVKKFVKSIWPPGRLLYNDIKRRKKVYLSDFSDGFNDLTSVKKYLNAMMFLYFTLLLPVMAFGVINSYNTHKAIETRKGILAQAVGGIIYALFAGQPLSVVQCTIPIVLFIKLVYTFSVSLFNVDFLTFYTLVGLWNGIFLVVYAITGVSKIMAYCSRSTEEIVGIFTSIAFIVDSLKYVSKQFGSYWCDESGCDKAIPLAVFLTTFGVLLVSLAINNFKYSPYLSSTKRKLVAEYGLPFSVLILSLITGILFDGLGLEHFTDEQFEQDPPYSLFSFPDFKWNGCHGDISKRAAATDDSSEPCVAISAGSFITSIALGFITSMLFFVEANVAASMVNNPHNKLQKGSAYHLDLLVTALINILLSVFGLPWMHACLPHSPMHVRALADIEERVEHGYASGVVVKVRETRTTTLAANVLVLVSMLLIPDPLHYISVPALYGVLLFIAISSLGDFQFWGRVKNDLNMAFSDSPNIPRLEHCHSMNWTKRKAVPLKDYHDEARATKDIEKFLENPCVLMKSKHTLLPDIINEMIEHIKTVKKINLNVEKAAKSVLADDGGLMECVQGLVYSRGSDVIPEKSFVVALGTTPTVVETQTCFSVTHRPFNLGDGLSEVKLICLILSPMKSKQTKSGIEVGRTYTTLLSANSLRRQLYEAKTVEEFVEIVKDGCKLVQERQTEEKEKERLEQMVGTETPEEEERPVKKFVKSIWPPGRLLYNDIKRRKKVYLSDFSDGFNDLTSVKKYLNAMMFLYFTLLLPVMAFGVINSYNTHKAIETRKGILAQAVGGIIYALFAGQPLSVVQCTIPIVLFIKLVYTFSVSLFNVDFLTFYTLVGLWNGIFLVVYAITGVSKIMAYCSRSTEEIVGIFTSIAFIVDSLKYVSKQFGSYWCDESGCDKAIPLAVFLTTFGVLLVSLAINNFKYSPYLSSTKRKLVAEYGLPFSVLILSLITGILFDGLGLEHFTDEQFEQDPPYSLFSFPDFKWNGCHGDISKRAAATDDSSEPCVAISAGSFITSIALGFITSMLFFVEANVAASMVNNPHNKLQKGSAYHLDLLVTALINILLSVFGLPWMHACLPHSPMHVRALADIEERVEHGYASGVVVKVRETRTTTLAANVLVLVSMLLIPDPLHYISVPALYGVLLFIAISSLGDFQFWGRVLLLFTEQSLYPAVHYVRKVPQKVIHTFTMLQLFQLYFLADGMSTSVEQDTSVQI
eukprot:sb/3460628/